MSRLNNLYLFLNDEKGRTLPRAKLFFYENNSFDFKNTYADKALTSVNPNPVIADGAGRFPNIFLEADTYRVVLQDEDGVEISTKDDVDNLLSDGDNVSNTTVTTSTGSQTVAGALDDRVVRVGSVAGLRALDVSVLSDDAGARITTTGRAGNFSWNSSDLSSQVTADTQSGIYVAPNSDLTGASGAWVRDISVGASVLISWFGAQEDGITDDNAAILAALSYNAGGVTEFSRGAVVISSEKIQTPDYTRINLNKAELRFVLVGNKENLRMGNNSWCVNGTVSNVGSGITTAESGHYQCPIAVGSYADGTSYENVLLHTLEVTSNRDNGNGIFVTSKSNNVGIHNIKFPSSTTIGRAILVHWGNADNFATETMHPYNIEISNIKAGTMSYNAADAAVVFVSAAHNTKVWNVNADSVVRALVTVFAGDYGYNYAAADVKPLALRGLNFSNCHCELSNDQGFRVDLITTKLGTNITYETDMEFNQCTTVGLGTVSAGNGFNITNCYGAKVKNCSAKKHFVGGIAGRNCKNVKFIGGDYEQNWLEGIRFTDSTTPPVNCRAIGLTAKDNNQSGGSIAGIGILDSVRCGATDCELGSDTESTQTWGVRVDNSSVAARLRDNHVDGVAGAGQAYSLGASTTYGVVEIFEGNTADPSIDYQGGVNPVQVGITGRGTSRRKLLLGSTPTSGTWDKGDTVYNDAPLLGAGGKIGAVCVTAGAPGTWKPFGAIDV